MDLLDKPEYANSNFKYRIFIVLETEHFTIIISRKSITRLNKRLKIAAQNQNEAAFLDKILPRLLYPIPVSRFKERADRWLATDEVEDRHLHLDISIDHELKKDLVPDSLKDDGFNSDVANRLQKH